MALLRISRIMLLGAAMAVANTGCVTALVGAGAVGAVGAGTMIAADSRSTGSMIDDESIELKGARIVSNNREISSASRIDVVSVNGIVVLTGQCPDKEYIGYVKDRVSKLDGVKKVYNYIENVEPVSLGQRSQDSWITSKVKTGLLFGEKINSGRFKVVTENSVVYLLGYVTRDEAARAVYVTRDISGVRKIVKLFDYMSDNANPAPIFGEGDRSNASNEVGVGTEPASAARRKEESSATAAPVYREEPTVLEEALPVEAERPQPVTVREPEAAERQPVPVTDILRDSSGSVIKPVPKPVQNPDSGAGPRKATPLIEDVNIRNTAPAGVVTDDDDSFIIE